MSVLSNGSISRFGSEYEFFVSTLIKLQKNNLLMTCTDSCNQNNIMKELVSLNFQKINNNVSLIFSNKINCSVCLKKVVFECIFENPPPSLFIQTYKQRLFMLMSCLNC